LVKLNVELANKTTENNTEKYITSNLKTDIKNKLYKEILDYIDSEKPYLNSNFSIADISERLNTNNKYISQAINENHKTNFNNFINKYRVDYARKLLLNPDNRNLSLEGIANIAGFNTRATFISAFKKFTGVTPSFFLKNQANN